MQWKVKLEGEDGTIGDLAKGCNPPATQILRDGVDWFLESSEFAYFTDHLDVKEKAKTIVQSLLAASTNPQANVDVSAIYRIHYDNSKSVFR